MPQQVQELLSPGRPDLLLLLHIPPQPLEHELRHQGLHRGQLDPWHDPLFFLFCFCVCVCVCVCICLFCFYVLSVSVLFIKFCPGYKDPCFRTRYVSYDFSLFSFLCKLLPSMCIYAFLLCCHELTHRLQLLMLALPSQPQCILRFQSSDFDVGSAKAGVGMAPIGE